MILNQIQWHIKTLLYHCKDPEKQSSFTLVYQNIRRKYKRNHHLFWSGIGPGTTLLGLNDKSKTALKNHYQR